ncbi:MAG: hypothetical protein KDA38_04080 [Planctomycetales bacterium]|nr:hypothetical protein [Planctomycetales bacterium]
MERKDADDLAEIPAVGVAQVDDRQTRLSLQFGERMVAKQPQRLAADLNPRVDRQLDRRHVGQQRFQIGRAEQLVQIRTQLAVRVGENH